MEGFSLRTSYFLSATVKQVLVHLAEGLFPESLTCDELERLGDALLVGHLDGCGGQRRRYWTCVKLDDYLYAVDHQDATGSVP